MGTEKTQNEIFNDAYQAYNGICSLIKGLYDSVLVRIDAYELSYKQTMAQVDKYIQSLLIGVAAADGKVDKDEAQFIMELPNYGTLFEDGGLKTGDDESLIKAMLEHSVATSVHIPTALAVIGKVVDDDKKQEFVELMLSMFLAIFSAFGTFDGRFVKAEVEFAKAILKPLAEALTTDFE